MLELSFYDINPTDMAQHNKISREEIAQFRNAVKGTRRLKQNKTTPFRRQLSTHPQQRLQDERQVLQDMFSEGWHPDEMETGEELLFLRNGIQHGVMRRLRRGQYSIGAELDLHGMTVREARQALSEFLRTTRHRCIRIIHGKGHGSYQKQPVLKGKVNHWLQQRNEVLAFCSALPVDGGTGALYVLLKNRR
jgi:DNA-nicking Smr family endonuclease